MITPTATGHGDFTFSSGTMCGDIPAATTITLKPIAGNISGQSVFIPVNTTRKDVASAGTVRSDRAGTTIRPSLALGPTGLLNNTGIVTGINNPGTGAQGANFSLFGSLTNAGTVVSYDLSVTGTYTQNAGTLDVTGNCTISNNGTFNFNGGTLTGKPVTLNANNTLNISPSAGPANFTFVGTTASLHAPSLAPGSVLNVAPVALNPALPAVVTADPLTNAGAITLKNASILRIAGPLSNPGTIDLQGLYAVLRLDYTTNSPADAVRQQLLTGHLTSSTAPSNSSLGYLDTGTQVQVWLTLLGDANLNGKLDPDDYALLDRAYAKSLASAHWTNGDFNYDGVITSADYLLIDATMGQTQGLSPEFLSMRESQFGSGYVSDLLASVPEPSVLVAGLPALLLFRKRRGYPTL